MRLFENRPLTLLMIGKILLIIFIFSILLVFFLIYQNQSVMLNPIRFEDKNLPAEDVQAESVFQPETPSLNQIFNIDHKWVATLSAERIRTVIATGDIIPARTVNFEILRHKDFNWPYLKSNQLTQAADITFANLESPEIKSCPVTNEGMIFCGDYRNIEGLKFAGIDVISLANNHAGNYGEEGVKETIDHLKNAGIETTGTALSNLVIKDIRGIRFAFLGFNDISKNQPGISDVDEEKIKNDIREAEKQAKIVIVSFHWGVEYRDQPDERQKYLGHLAVDAGADLVIGNHPHWIQPVEIYKDKLIIYAHGNFVFDQEWSIKTKLGVVGKYTFYDNQLIDVEFFPLQIENYGQPNLLTGDKKQIILDEMSKESIILSLTTEVKK